MSSRYDIGRLRDEASQALKTKRLDQALVAYLELERVDPDSDWPRRAAAVYVMLGRSKDAIDALLRAERWYSKRGEVLKAAAVCKHILQLDPHHDEALRRVQSLKSEWDKARGTAIAEPLEKSEVAPTSRVEVAIRSMAKNDGLAKLPLHDVVPGAVPTTEMSGIYRIPLQEREDSVDISVEGAVSASGVAGAVVLDAHGNVRPAPAQPDTEKKARAEAVEDEMIATVERGVRVTEEVNALLASNPLFSALDEASFAQLVMHARLVELEARAVLFRQGDVGNALYVIVEGRVGVIDEGPPRRGLAQLRDGDFFGEIALIADQPRNATIVALQDTKLIEIDRHVILELIAAEPTLLTALLRFLRDRLAGKLMSTNPLFMALSERDQAALRTRFRFLEVDQGAVLLAEGKKPEGLLLLLTGSAEVVRIHDGAELEIGRLGPGDTCGEMGLLSGEPSIGTVRTTKKCLVLELPAQAFIKIVHARPQAMAFVKEVIDKRTARAKQILAGAATYGEGRIRF